MAAAVEQKPGLARRDHRGPKRQSRHGAPGAFADAVGKGDDAGRAVVTLLETAGDDADDAGMPAFAGGEDEGRVALAAFGLFDGRGRRPRLRLARLGSAVSGS